tara:strand:+ start:142 stop:801 length:660 start_codon:yes stop_codon:yes gene_type:complete
MFIDNKMNNNLEDKINYFDNLNYSIKDIIGAYKNIIINYTKTIIDKNIVSFNNFKYIYLKGLNIINNVFKLILLYTNNLDITNYHSEKVYYYYIEFIGQIKTNSNNFLDLTIDDATIFVYKKTIFNLNRYYKCSESGLLNEINIIIDGLSLLIFHFIKYDNINIVNTINEIIQFIKNNDKYVSNNMQYNKLTLLLNTYDIDINNMSLFETNYKTILNSN